MFGVPPAAALRLDRREGAARWQVDGFFHHTSGDYGIDEETKATSLGVTVARLFPLGRLSATIPYVSITGRGEVTFVAGNPKRRSKVQTRVEEMTESGLGDIILRGYRLLSLEKSNRPEIGVLAFVKLPTADEEDGLGTGEFDGGVTMDVYKTLQRRFFALAEWGYTVVGDPPGIDYNDKWMFSLGGGRELIRPMFIAFFYAEERAIIAGEDNPQSLTASLRFLMTERASMGLAFLLGLSDGAPDLGLSLSGRVRF